MNQLAVLKSFGPRISIPKNSFLLHHARREVGLSIHY